MTRGVLLVSLLCASGCSSWDTGSDSVDDNEHLCLETIETFARAAQRCELDYKTSYDQYLKRDARGDCKNVKAVRDAAALRDKCLPSVRTQTCETFRADQYDQSCFKQLQRDE